MGQSKIAKENNVKSEISVDSKMKLSEVQKMAAQCWLAEFEGLRNEILSFQRMQHNLIWTNISIIGTLLAIYFAYQSDKTDMILLAVPIVSSLLGVCWVAQGRRISQIGHYIKYNIAPALQTLCHDKKIMGWEDEIREGIETGFFIYVRDLLLLRVPRATGGGLIFVVSSVMGIVITAIGLGRALITCNKWQIASVWWVGLMLTLWFIVSGYKLGQYWIWIKAAKDK
ncbi:MAG: hypothetical protein L6305_09185 [Actinomycetia bacterium]|nr:hypothetical protein [bacterium]MBU4509647.1 hypothetical protein [bacterium]MCG2791899.1 hypothetical protein [Actinomycetes bacterium]